MRSPQIIVQEKLLSSNTLAEMRPERIGSRLRYLREALGMSPSEISDLLGVERTYWSRWEGGKRPISETAAALLAERFGVTLDFIFLGKAAHLPFELAKKIRELEDRDTSLN